MSGASRRVCAARYGWICGYASDQGSAGSFAIAQSRAGNGGGQVSYGRGAGRLVPNVRRRAVEFGWLADAGGWKGEARRGTCTRTTRLSLFGSGQRSSD